MPSSLRELHVRQAQAEERIKAVEGRAVDSKTLELYVNSLKIEIGSLKGMVEQVGKDVGENRSLTEQHLKDSAVGGRRPR